MGRQGGKSMSMNMGTNVIYWPKNQVGIRFHSAFSQSDVASAQKFSTGVSNLQEQMNNVVLKDLYTLQRIGSSSMPQANAQQMMQAETDTDGVFLFPAPRRTIDTEEMFDAVIFYDILPPGGMGTMPGMAAMQDSGGSADMVNDTTMDHTLDLIDYLHNNPGAFQKANILASIGIPNWFWSGNGDQTHGCPVSPPIPVEPSTALGLWTIALQDLSDPSLQSATGKGVNVFILDTLPTVDTISTAAQNVGDKNTLLQAMTNGMVSETPYNAVPPAINLNYSFNVEVLDPSKSAVTGKDIYGQLVGFSMADHGLSIAGIVRDLAPEANIECIRVLNDYGVGTLNTLMDALRYIQRRIGEEGDLYQKPVVINLSLVVLPPPNGMPNGVTLDSDIMKESLNILSTLIQNMTSSHQVIFVTSVGNDSDPRDTEMNPAGVHFNPRYPANFANDTAYNISSVIPVGAVNQYREPASYSNYPGPNGIATYVGDTPSPIPPECPKDATTEVTVEMPLDALRGVYSAGMFPVLSLGEMHPNTGSPSELPMHQVPDSNAWAYWTGTSFAAPIISALAARMLELQPDSVDNLRQTILATAPQQTMWMNLESGAEATGPLIMVTQDWWTKDDGTQQN
jgi:hypothetical protein